MILTSCVGAGEETLLIVNELVHKRMWYHRKSHYRSICDMLVTRHFRFYNQRDLSRCGQSAASGPYKILGDTLRANPHLLLINRARGLDNVLNKSRVNVVVGENSLCFKSLIEVKN
jgi:hypothetical protein